MYDPYKELYIHIPFCKKRCSYCDFTTQASDSDNPIIDEYIDSLVLSIRHAAKEGKLAELDTVYIGGGTPSYIGQRRLSKLLYTLSLSMHLTPEVECSMEANPESITENLIKDIWALGVTRLSIGVQSFHDSELSFLGRIHTAEEARTAISCALSRFDNVSIDLICGIPGQSLDDFKDSLEIACGLGINHISIYPLTIEEGTLLDRKLLSGNIEEIDEDMQAEMMHMAETVLLSAGFRRYEVASYAKPGYECRHNIGYWTGKPYLGLGVSSVTMTQDANRRVRVQDGQVIEELNKTQMIAEDLMLRMRMSEGVSINELSKASQILPQAKETFERLVEDGFVERFQPGEANESYRPSHKGWLCGNELYAAILDLSP